MRLPLTASQVQARLRALRDRDKAKFLQGFFKTKPGEYAAGDVFLGLTVPQVRIVTKQFQSLPLPQTSRLLRSRFHEERLAALLILVGEFARGDDAMKARIYSCYRSHLRWINNWDLVDTSAAQIVGGFLERRSRAPLLCLARSKTLWERRIAIIATFHFIKHGEFAPTLRIARHLLRDPEDLIHKAVGWMLREVGKRDLATEEQFLHLHYRRMPRTMLRYAIERFPESKRQRYLCGAV